MTRRSRDREDGWVLVSAIVLMAIMLSVGLSSYAFVDTGQKRSRESRERESSLSLAEAALYAQGFALTRLAEPEQAARRRLLLRRGAHGDDALLPRPRHARQGELRQRGVAQFASTDYGANATWTTSVRDNYGVLKASYDPAHANDQLTEAARRRANAPCPPTPVPDGLQRRQPAVGPGQGDRPRQAAQHRRPPEAREAPRERSAGRRRRRRPAGDQQRQQADGRRHGQHDRRALHRP